MKTLLILCVSAIHLAGEEIGRYQLFQAPTEHIGKSSSINQQTVFRIDTVTGKTCIYMSATIDGKLVYRWTEVAEPSNTAFAEIMAQAMIIEWATGHTDGGYYPFENPARRVTAEEVKDIKDRADARMRMLTTIASLAGGTNSPAKLKP